MKQMALIWKTLFLGENITVLNNYHKAAMSIHNADQADIRDVHFRNITVENAYQVGDIWTEDYD